jgi:hypothetical protein
MPETRLRRPLAVHTQSRQGTPAPPNTQWFAAERRARSTSDPPARDARGVASHSPGHLRRRHLPNRPHRNPTRPRSLLSPTSPRWSPLPRLPRLQCPPLPQHAAQRVRRCPRCPLAYPRLPRLLLVHSCLRCTPQSRGVKPLPRSQETCLCALRFSRRSATPRTSVWIVIDSATTVERDDATGLRDVSMTNNIEMTHGTGRRATVTQSRGPHALANISVRACIEWESGVSGVSGQRCSSS